MGKFFSRFEEYFIAFLMAAMTVVNFANVFVRYVLKSNLHWALEFTVISFAWIIFLGAAWGIKSGAHIGVDTVLNLFSDKNKRIISTPSYDQVNKPLYNKSIGRWKNYNVRWYSE